MLIINDLYLPFPILTRYDGKMQSEKEQDTKTHLAGQCQSQGDRLVSSGTIQTAAEVSRKTVTRWVKEFGWTVVKFNSRLVRYHKSEVEKSLGIKL